MVSLCLLLVVSLWGGGGGGHLFGRWWGRFVSRLWCRFFGRYFGIVWYWLCFLFFWVVDSFWRYSSYDFSFFSFFYSLGLLFGYIIFSLVLLTFVGLLCRLGVVYFVRLGGWFEFGSTFFLWKIKLPCTFNTKLTNKQNEANKKLRKQK